MLSAATVISLLRKEFAQNYLIKPWSLFSMAVLMCQEKFTCFVNFYITFFAIFMIVSQLLRVVGRIIYSETIFL